MRDTKQTLEVPCLHEVHEEPIVVRRYWTGLLCPFSSCVSVNKCHHAFCHSCLVAHIWREGEKTPAAARHKCPARGCKTIMQVPPRGIPSFTAVCRAIWYATVQDDDAMAVMQWCSDGEMHIDELFP